MYEYVKKSEYAPVRKDLERIINRVQNEMRKRYKLTFQFRLIGSGKRHLVTRICGGNRGYDFDYNLIIPHPGTGYCYKANVIKQEFMSAFKIALKGTEYSFPKDSTSALTIKMINKNRICHSCDFAIIYYGSCDENDGYYYLRNNKKQQTYEFAFRPLKSDIEEKVNAVRKEEDGWNYLREEYMLLKNNNEGKGKSSFSIYQEAVNNAFNHLILR